MSLRTSEGALLAPLRKENFKELSSFMESDLTSLKFKSQGCWEEGAWALCSGKQA